MNRTEKLLAARKKLKEFQLNKVTHNPESIVDQTQNNVQKVEAAEDTIVPESTQQHHFTPNENVNETPVDTQLHEDHDSAAKYNVSTERLINLNEPAPNLMFDQQKSSEIMPDLPVNNVKKELSDFFQSNEDKVWPPEQAPLQTTSTTENGATFYDSEINVSSQNGFYYNSPLLNPPKITPSVEDIVDSDNKIIESTPTIDLEQQRMIEHLQAQVLQYRSEVSNLQHQLSAKDTEIHQKLSHELEPLKEEIRVQTQTIKILVAEKAELGNSFAQYQTIAEQKSSEVEELRKKIRSSQSQLEELTKQLSQSRDAVEEMHKMYNQLQINHVELDEKFVELNKVKEEQQQEMAELRQELNIKNNESTKLAREMEETKNLLSLAELKIQQLTNIPQELQVLEAQQSAKDTMEQQLTQLRENLKTITQEKDEMCKHYESYVTQMDARCEKVSSELEASQKIIADLESREESLIQRLSLMEQRYQQEKQKVEKLLPLQAHEEQIGHLTKSMDSLTLENESLQAALREKEAEVESMKEELQELRELKEQSGITTKLATALESEQLGASRAVSQNQQLKAQLDEMHDAFFTLTNSKLNLTEQLQSERTIGRKLNAELSRFEAEMDELKAEIIRKDAVIEELEKEKLHSAQIADQMQHYRSESSQARTLQEELQNSLMTIEFLKRENQRLTKQLNVSNENKGAKMESTNIQNGVDTVENINGDEEVVVAEEIPEIPLTESDVKLPAIDGELSEAKIKLEARFKESMERVAELTDEKQRLEHLVLQLQSETETIGEYITLYQKQRSILQTKAQEREKTFRQLIEQRNQQQEQLHQLKVLVADLLKSQQNATLSSTPNETVNPSVVPELAGNTDVPDQGTSTQTSPASSVIDPKDNTTAKILDLLTEIKDCNDTCSLEPTFHPCLWCSGKLITV